jgi:hypothetical protein
MFAFSDESKDRIWSSPVVFSLVSESFFQFSQRDQAVICLRTPPKKGLDIIRESVVDACANGVTVSFYMQLEIMV